MAVQGFPINDESFTAQADFSAKQYYPVKLSGAGGVDLCTNGKDIVVGVVQDNVTSGRECTVRRLGRTKVISDGTLSGGAISAGDFLMASSSGVGKKAGAAGNPTFAIAEEASTVAGRIISVTLLAPGLTFQTATSSS